MYIICTDCSIALQLRVREHQVFGPYVEDLSTYVASSYSDIEVRCCMYVCVCVCVAGRAGLTWFCFSIG